MPGRCNQGKRTYVVCPFTYPATRQHRGATAGPWRRSLAFPFDTWHYAIKAASAGDEVVVLHSPHGLRGPSRRPICGGEGDPGSRLDSVLKVSGYVVCPLILNAARYHCGGTTGGNQATFGSPFFFVCRLCRSRLVQFWRENIIQPTFSAQVIEGRSDSATLTQSRQAKPRLIVTQSGLGPSQPGNQLPLLDTSAFSQLSDTIHDEDSG